MEAKIFGKIIHHMKQRHQRKENYPISLEDILEEIQEVDLSPKIKNILDTHVRLARNIDNKLFVICLKALLVMSFKDLVEQSQDRI